MLIDCGHPSLDQGRVGSDPGHRRDIKIATDGKIDVLVVTHEHMDHVSGFLSAAAIFKDIEIGAVWMAWSEDPKDPDAVAFDNSREPRSPPCRAQAVNWTADKSGNAFLGGLRDGFAFRDGAYQFGAAGERCGPQEMRRLPCRKRSRRSI